MRIQNTFLMLARLHLTVLLGTLISAPVWAQWSSGESSTRRSTIRIKDSSIDASPFSPGSHNIALDLGQVFLMGDLTRYHDSIGTQVHYSYGVSDLFGFDSSIGYSEHSDGRYGMVSFLTGMRMNLSWYDKVIPFAVLGLGFYRPNYKDWTAATPSQGQPDNSSVSALLFGIHFGPGVDLEISRNLFFGASLTFHTLFGTTKELANATPLNLGGSYMSFLLHTGVTF